MLAPVPQEGGQGCAQALSPRRLTAPSPAPVPADSGRVSPRPAWLLADFQTKPLPPPPLPRSSAPAQQAGVLRPSLGPFLPLPRPPPLPPRTSWEEEGREELELRKGRPAGTPSRGTGGTWVPSSVCCPARGPPALSALAHGASDARVLTVGCSVHSTVTPLVSLDLGITQHCTCSLLF